MKILMVTNTYLPIVGGLEKSIESFTDQFRAWGHEVKIVVPELDGIEIKRENHIHVAALHPCRQKGFSLPFPVFSALAKEIDLFRPDIVHSHHPFLMGEMALRLAARYRKPLIFTYHILFDHYTHYLPLPTSLSRRFLVELAGGYANLSSRVVAPSESVRRILLTEGVRRPIDIVPTGVNYDFFSKGSGQKVRAALGIPQNGFVLGYVGRIVQEKNLEFLAEAAVIFMEQHRDVHFVTVGKGLGQKTLREIFEKAGFKSRFHDLGVLQGKELADCYAAMDVFVFASQSETQGMVLCEAMAAGVPVIAIDAPGVREVVKDLKNGRLLPSENLGYFATALNWAKRCRPDQWQKIKESARRTAKSFSVENCSRNLLQVYERAIRDNLAAHYDENDDWHTLIRQMKTEWAIASNIGRATGLALKELGKS